MSTSMEPVLRWAAQMTGIGARVVDVKGLRAGAGPWRLRLDQGGKTIEAVLRVGDNSSRQQLATEAAALRFAEDHQLAAPRLLAVDLDGAAAGMPVLVMTVLAGSSTIPTIKSTARLRALGAAAAALHTVATPPRPDLPLRVRPLADVDFAAERRATGSSRLLEAAEERVHEMAVPQGRRCWSTATCGRATPCGPARPVWAWSTVAQWLPVAHAHGRVDLDAVTLMDRRDAFLRAALEQLDRA
jgi:aminoglycoside phosphotransferase